MGTRQFLTLATLGVAAAVLGGCTTYVNIPSRAGDVAVHNPNDDTVKDVEAGALRGAISERPINEPFEVILPEGSLPSTYDWVLPHVGPHAVWSKNGAHEGQPVVEVREIRIRGSSAQVDVIRPWDPGDPSGYQQLVTVELSWDPITHWQTDRVAGWRTSVDKALRTKPYEPPPDINR